MPIPSRASSGLRRWSGSILAKHRAARILLAALDAMQQAIPLDEVALTQPARADAADLRMQRPHVEPGTPQRHSVADEPPAQFVEHLDDALDTLAFAQQPTCDLTARDRSAQAGVGALGVRGGSSPLVVVSARRCGMVRSLGSSCSLDVAMQYGLSGINSFIKADGAAGR